MYHNAAHDDCTVLLADLIDMHREGRVRFSFVTAILARSHFLQFFNCHLCLHSAHAPLMRSCGHLVFTHAAASRRAIMIFRKFWDCRPVMNSVRISACSPRPYPCFTFLMSQFACEVSFSGIQRATATAQNAQNILSLASVADSYLLFSISGTIFMKISINSGYTDF